MRLQILRVTRYTIYYRYYYAKYTLLCSLENVVLLLDLLRNRILKFELLLSVASFVVTLGALVTGVAVTITTIAFKFNDKIRFRIF